MWWYSILGDNEGSIPHILRLDNINSGSSLLTTNLVELKRGNRDPVLTVKRTKWRKFFDYLSLSIEANPSRVVKKNIYIIHIGYIISPSSVKLHILRQNLDKEFNFWPQNLCLYQLTKTLAADIAPHKYSALRNLYLGRILLLFSYALLKKCTVVSWHHHYYTFLNKLSRLNLIYIVFMISYFLIL